MSDRPHDKRRRTPSEVSRPQPLGSKARQPRSKAGATAELPPPPPGHRRAVYAGSFDPLTNGHVDIIERAFSLCDELVVAVVKNPSKTSLFTLEERRAMIETSLGPRANLLVDSFSGLLVNYVANKGASLIVRGLRALSDFEFEYQMALMNRKLNPAIETVFMMTQDRYAFLSSSTVREVSSLGGSITGLVPPYVEQLLLERLGSDPSPTRAQRVDQDS